jgi:hypothetical protein
MKVKSILKEPLFHFFVLGVFVYVLYGLFASFENEPAENTIVVTKGEIDWMKDTWTKRWNRPPTYAELEGLIDQHIEESIFYQEALKMGLDQNDVIIRRRLAQKLKFLQEDLLKPGEPSEEELKDYFIENISIYSSDEVITLTQIFYDPDKRGSITLQDAENDKSRLTEMDIDDIDPKIFGDYFMLQNYYPGRSQQDIAKLFGSEFARNVMSLEPDKWHGPVLSGYGTHLVYVTDRIEPVESKFEDVRDLVLEDWRVDQQEKMNQLFAEGVIARYTVIIEDEDSIQSIR